MKHLALLAATALTVGFVSNAAAAKDLPAGGMTAEQIASWLQDAGYKARVETEKDGTKSVASSSDGSNFYVDTYDCDDTHRCTALQFAIGFDTKGAWNATKMNDWNLNKRWARASVDANDDPWLRMDVDLSPGGTEEGLDDQFAVWRKMLSTFKTFINW